MAAKTMKVPRIKLGSQGLEVSVQGLGCNRMMGNYGAEHDLIALIHHAVDSGTTFLDTSDIYGPFLSEVLLGKALKGIRHKVQLATKFGIVKSNGKASICGDPDYVRAACEGSLKRLDVDYIDLYYQHRVDTTIPIEITVGAMKELVQEGKVKYIGLSEASASTIRRAHAVHPITAVQLEWSLCSRDVEQDIIPTCRELGIGIVAYSPLCRGLLSAGKKALEIATGGVDVQKLRFPRFKGENLENNQRLYLALSELASRKGCTPGQLALAWVQHQGDDVVPIPGTTKVENFEENVAALQVELSVEDAQEMEALFHVNAVVGDRYADMNFWGYVHAQTPPLSSWKVSG